MLKIGNIVLKNNIISGPMAGISNPAFNYINIRFNAGLVCNEMVSDKALLYNNKKTYDMLIDKYNSHPISYQIFGGEVDSMVKAAIYLDKHTNCDIIDINMGCPVNKVIKAKAGSYLLTNPKLAYDIVKNIVDNVNKPVTVKLRLGYDEKNINIIEMSKLMEKAGASAIIIHCRTRSQFYSGKCDYSYLKLVKEAISIPVIANGDIDNIYLAKEILDTYKVDGIMISRGSIGNPYIFDNINRYINNLELINPLLEDKINLCLEHTKLLIDCINNETNAIKQMRGIVNYYIKGINNASKIREKINNITSFSQLEELLNNIKNNN